MSGIYIRKLASAVLRAMLRICPREVAPWGHAMLGELRKIEGPWEALLWGLGGAEVLLSESLLSPLTRETRGRAYPSAPLIVGREDAMRGIKVTLSWFAVAASVTFLFAPSFRQAIVVSLQSWQVTLTRYRRPSDRPLVELAAEARQRKDPELMAFVALRLWHNPISNELAEEAARLNPSLTWVYMIFSSPYHQPPDAEARIRELEKRDPQNAFPYLVEADHIFVARHAKNYDYTKSGIEVFEDEPRWLDAMAAAFRASKYDSYLARRLDLDRSVMRRYHFHDPFILLGAFTWLQGPSVYIYSKYLLNSGKESEAKGDLQQASLTFSTVAHFCQLAQSNAQTDFERLTVSRTQLAAYQGLESIARKSGGLSEAELLNFEIRQLEDQRQRMPGTAALAAAYRWNAVLVQASSLVLLLSTAFVMLTVAASLARQWLQVGRASRLYEAISLVGAVGALGSFVGAVTLYVSYQPYAEAFRAFMAARGAEQFRLLNLFLWLPEGGFVALPVLRSPYLDVYLWWILIFAAGAGLAFGTARSIRKNRRVHQPA